MRSLNRTHDRQSFFKYVSAETARVVLQNRTLRWSSPRLFNDPFDVPRELSFGVAPKAIMDALASRMEAILTNPPADTSRLDPKLRVLVQTIKNGIRDELRADLVREIRDCAATSQPTGEGLKAMQDQWMQWLPQLRILCLTQSPNHTAMWYHYADRYRGVVLEFRCVDELDSAWLGAKPVTYPEAKPCIYSSEGWAELLTLDPDLAIRQIFDVAVFTKAPDWRYEEEWRVMSFRRHGETGEYSDYRFSPIELAGVYFGPHISAVDDTAIEAMCAIYPELSMWDVAIGMSRELEITERERG
jgi:hypothetical protein